MNAYNYGKKCKRVTALFAAGLMWRKNVDVGMMNDMITVHFVPSPNGTTACGRYTGRPTVWPPGDFYAATWPSVDCAECLAKKPGDHEVMLDEISTKASLPVLARQSGDKRLEPAYKDTDLMPFGLHKGRKLSNVPAKYLCWLWSKRPVSDRKLQNYIHNEIAALKKDYPDGVWT